MKNVLLSLKKQIKRDILICMLKASDVHEFVNINDNLDMQILAFEETIYTRTFIEYLA